jgi:hypothetical protein
MAVVYSSAAASAAALYSETFWESSLVSAISLAFSSAGAAATFLPISFCSLEFLQRGTTNLVGAQHLVDQFDRFATLALGFLNNVSMFTNELDIKHAS